VIKIWHGAWPVYRVALLASFGGFIGRVVIDTFIFRMPRDFCLDYDTFALVALVISVACAPLLVRFIPLDERQRILVFGASVAVLASCFLDWNLSTMTPCAPTFLG
jgi:hypothetical protein